MPDRLRDMSRVTVDGADIIPFDPQSEKVPGTIGEAIKAPRWIAFRLCGGGPEKTAAENDAAWLLAKAQLEAVGGGILLAEPGITRFSAPHDYLVAIELRAMGPKGRVFGPGDTARAPVAVFEFVGDGAPHARTLTRRLYRGSAADPKDAPITPCINIQYPGCKLHESMCIRIANGASGWDSNVLVGSRLGVVIDATMDGVAEGWTVHVDVTRATNLPETQPEFPTTYASGADGFVANFPVWRGGKKGVFGVLGALPKAGLAWYGSRYTKYITATIGSVVAGDTLTLAGLVFTFVTSPAGDYEVEIGATPADTTTNLLALLVGLIDAGIAETQPVFASGVYLASGNVLSILDRYQISPGGDFDGYVASTSSAAITLSGSTPTTQPDPALYYDEATGAVPDYRGTYGASDILLFRPALYGNQTIVAPTGSAATDTSPCVIMVDGMAGNSSGCVQGIRFEHPRFSGPNQMARLRRANRVYFEFPHFDREGSSNSYLGHVTKVAGTTRNVGVWGASGSRPSSNFDLDTGTYWAGGTNGRQEYGGAMRLPGPVSVGVGRFNGADLFADYGKDGFTVRDGADASRSIGRLYYSKSGASWGFGFQKAAGASWSTGLTVAWTQGSDILTFASVGAAGGLVFNNSAGETDVRGFSGVRLRYGNVTRALTTATGLTTYGTVQPGTDNTDVLGSNTRRYTQVVAAKAMITDGVAEPATVAGFAQIYVDAADGDLKVKFGDGTVKTIALDT